MNGGEFMRAATLKGLVCHTAYDAGNPGPDYIYGWGLLDINKAAQCITDNGLNSLLIEQTLIQAQTKTYKVVASGSGAIKATIAWTDPEGRATTLGIINDRTPKLVNDLDIRVNDGSVISMPWVLDVSNPGIAATRGDNIRDNVEQVIINQPVAGKTYAITISHKGRLTYDLQNYSLVVTGIQGSSFDSTPDNDIALQVFPVPAKNQLNVAFNSTIKNSLVIKIFDSQGRQVYVNSRQVLQGAYINNMDVINFTSGLYFMQLQLGDKMYVRKLIIAK